MTIESMTGFAEAHGAHGTLRWRWEIKSVNGRGLEMRLRTPPGFDGIESAGRTLAGERFKRGNLQANMILEPLDSARGLKVDPVALGAAVKIAKEIADDTGLPPARVDGLLALKGVLVQDEVQSLEPAERAARDAAVVESMAQALDQLRRARGAEGAKLATVFGSILDEIEKLTTDAGNLAAAQPAAIRDRLAAQITDLLGANTVPEERLAQEAALLAVRADIREELDRLRSHIEDARKLLDAGKAIGRKLDFLSQEFNREANTLCSKSSDIQLTRLGLALKAAIDQFREQAQNVE